MYIEKEIKLVITDSGTVVEKCTIVGTHFLSNRDSTERADLIELEVNTIRGIGVEQVLDATELCVSKQVLPVTHYRNNISEKICNILIRNSLTFIRGLICKILLYMFKLLFSIFKKIIFGLNSTIHFQIV